MRLFLCTTDFKANNLKRYEQELIFLKSKFFCWAYRTNCEVFKTKLAFGDNCFAIIVTYNLTKIVSTNYVHFSSTRRIYTYNYKGPFPTAVHPSLQKEYHVKVSVFTGSPYLISIDSVPNHCRHLTSLQSSVSQPQQC